MGVSLCDMVLRVRIGADINSAEQALDRLLERSKRKTVDGLDANAPVAQGMKVAALHHAGVAQE